MGCMIIPKHLRMNVISYLGFRGGNPRSANRLATIWRGSIV